MEFSSKKFQTNDKNKQNNEKLKQNQMFSASLLERSSRFHKRKNKEKIEPVNFSWCANVKYIKKKKKKT